MVIPGLTPLLPPSLATQKAQGSRPKTQDVLEPSRGGSAAAATDDGGSPG